MKLAQDNNIMLSNAPAPETHSFGVTDMRIIMEVLTKLYANPIQTLTQEYISNARDAHREIKQTKQIEITAPTRFNAVMKIRDFGPGLSPERIASVFIFYGASTKRDTNSQTGGFGIGAKSAWSYTDSFVIVSYCDGIKRTYNAHKSKGTGNLDKIAEETTNEPNGVSIEIAVNPQDVTRFRAAIVRTIFFWKASEKPIVKGIDVSEMPEYKPKFTEFLNIHVFDQLPQVFSGNTSCIVVDGIPYPNRNFTPKLNQKIRGQFALFLETGHVDIAPNREELISDDKTKRYLTTLDEKGEREVTAYIAKQMSNLSALKDSLKVAADLKTQFNTEIRFRNYNFNYNGITVFDPKTNNQIELGDTWEFYRNKWKKGTFYNVDLNEIDNIYYDDMPNESATKKVWRVKKTVNSSSIRQFKLIKNTLDPQVAIDFGAKPLSSIDASDYTVNRAAKAAVQKLEICLHYFTYQLNPTQVNISTITDTIVYDLCDSPVYARRSSSKVINFINGLPGHKVAFIAKGCEWKVVGNKQFVKYDDFIKNYKASDAQLKYYLKSKDYCCGPFEGFGVIAKEVKDKDLKYIFELAAFNPGNAVSSCTLPDEFIDKDHKLVKEYTAHLVEVSANVLSKKYPLFNSFDRSALKNLAYRSDVVHYLNSKYEASNP